MNKSNGFLYAFGVCRTTLTVSGLWSEIHFTEAKKFLTTIIFTVNIFVILTFINVAQTVKLFMIWGDFDEMNQIISTADFSIGIVVVKMFIFRGYRTGTSPVSYILQALAPLIEFAKQDWSEMRNPSELETMETNSRTANWIYIVCLILGNCTVNSYTLLRVGQELGIFPGPPVKRLPLFDAYFPYNDSRTPAYEITWFMQYMGAFLGNMAFTGSYCLFVGLMMHLCSQFKILKDRLIAIVGENSSSSDFQEKLRLIVERHESLIRYAQVVEKIYNRMFLAEILSSTIQMCTQWFMLVTLLISIQGGFPYLQVVFLLIFTTHSGFHLFACCYTAERMQNESSAIFEAAYDCDWFMLPPQKAKLLIVVMQRSRIPLQVTAGKVFIFGMELYAKILKTAGGYLSLLLAVRDRLVD